MRRPTRDPRRALRLLGALAGVGLVIGGFAVYTLLQRAGSDSAGVAPQQQASARVPRLVSSARLAEQDGIRIVHVAVTGAGGLLDLRYQVIDADKAAVVHATPPELVDETTGAVVDQLLMGHQHKGLLHAGQTYYLIFENPGNLVQRGRQVTVALGGLRVQHIPVE